MTIAAEEIELISPEIAPDKSKIMLVSLVQIVRVS